MSTSLPITTAQLVGLFAESICYGVYLVTLGTCLRVLIWDREGQLKRKPNWRMLVITMLLAVFATLNVAFGLLHNLDAFVYYTGPGGPATEFGDISNWVNVVKNGDLAAQIIIGDALLVYRCFVVYGERWLVIIPSILLWLGGLASGISFTVTMSRIQELVLAYNTQEQPFVKAMLAFTLATNALTTGLIVYRIWSVDRMSAPFRVSEGKPSLRWFMQVFIESAALYTVSVFVFVVCYAANSNAAYVVSDMVVQIIGISFNLVIIRLDPARNIEAPPSASERSITHWSVARSRRPMQTQASTGTVAIHMSVQREIVMTIDKAEEHQTAEKRCSLASGEAVDCYCSSSANVSETTV